MNRFIRISLTVVAFILLAAIVVGAILLVVTVRRPFPEAAGTVAVPGLQDEVHVYRDEWGIPHIYAQNEHDLFFAQGYVHAQDRFWQMEFWRHIGQGRVSEIAGEAALDSDKFIRTMGWNRMGQQTLTYVEEEAPEYMAILEAYSAGVNAYIEANRDTLSLNYTVLGLVNEPWEIEPWTPLNTLTWGAAMAHDLGGNWNDELRRARLINELGEATVASLLPPYPHDKRPVIVPTETMDNELPEAETGLNPATVVDWSRVNTDIVGEVPESGFALGGSGAIGSNSWVISGDHTATGIPLLANDPHLGIQMPSIWYEIGLHAPGWNVAGFSFAGVPGVIIGHNDRIAWGFTNVGPDVQDLYIEKINPSNPLQYEYMGEWEDMDVIEEVIKVNGGEDIVLAVRLSRHGPIINEVVDGQSDVLAMKWTAQEPSRVFLSIILLNQAENYEEFREALQYFDVPAQNVVYADVEGNIAYQMPGRIPIRQNGDGLVPVPGWTGEYEWQAWIPYEQLPAALNPEQGYIVTANNAVVDPEYPYLIARDWDSGDRAQRITELLEEAIAGGKVTADDFARIQFDNKSLIAAAYVPLFAGLSSNDSQVQAAIERLRGWDLREHRASVPAALFEIFFTRLVYNVLADEVGEDNVLDAADIIFFHELVGQPDARWWDDARTDGRETREDVVLRALAETIDWFEENVGGDMNNWTWGSIHTATFVSAPLGQTGIGPVESVVNRGPFPADGGRHIVNANSWDRSDPAAVTGHPSMRMIVDMSDFDASRAVIPTGQSGHPYHPHYDDMIELWLNGEYHPMRFSREAVEAAAVDHLVLQPGG
ncbi:MAG TPA: penicillin acylase family protein [Anaerolineae bacterium]